MIRKLIVAAFVVAALGATATGCGSSHDNLARPTFLYNCTSCHS